MGAKWDCTNSNGFVLKFKAISWQFWDKFQPGEGNFYDDSGSSRVIIYAF